MRDVRKNLIHLLLIVALMGFIAVPAVAGDLANILQEEASSIGFNLGADAAQNVASQVETESDLNSVMDNIKSHVVSAQLEAAYNDEGVELDQKTMDRVTNYIVENGDVEGAKSIIENQLSSSSDGSGGDYTTQTSDGSDQLSSSSTSGGEEQTGSPAVSEDDAQQTEQALEEKAQSQDMSEARSKLVDMAEEELRQRVKKGFTEVAQLGNKVAQQARADAKEIKEVKKLMKAGQSLAEAKKAVDPSANLDLAERSQQAAQSGQELADIAGNEELSDQLGKVNEGIEVADGGREEIENLVEAAENGDIDELVSASEGSLKAAGELAEMAGKEDLTERINKINEGIQTADAGRQELEKLVNASEEGNIGDMADATEGSFEAVSNLAKLAGKDDLAGRMDDRANQLGDMQDFLSGVEDVEDLRQQTGELTLGEAYELVNDVDEVKALEERVKENEKVQAVDQFLDNGSQFEEDLGEYQYNDQFEKSASGGDQDLDLSATPEDIYMEEAYSGEAKISDYVEVSESGKIKNIDYDGMAKAGYDVGAQGSADIGAFKLGDQAMAGIRAELGVSATASIEGRLDLETNVGSIAGRDIDLFAEIKGGATAGAEAKADAYAGLGSDGIAIGGSVGGFAGIKAEGSVSGGASVEGVGKAYGTVSAYASAGISGEATARVQIGLDGVNYKAEAGATVGVGAGASISGGIKFDDEFKNTLKNKITELQMKDVKNAGRMVANNIGSNLVSNLKSSAKDFAKNKVTDMIPDLGDVKEGLENLGDKVGDGLGNIGDGISDLGGALSSGARNIGGAVRERTDKVANRIRDVGDDIKNRGKEAKRIRDKIRDKVKNTGRKIRDKVKNTGRKIRDKVRNTGRKIRDKARNTGRKIRDKVKNTGRKIRDKARNTGRKIRDKVRNTGRKIRDKVKNTGHKIRDKARNTGRKIRDKVKNTGHKIRDKARDTGRKVHNKVKDAGRKVRDKARSTGRKIKDKGKDAIDKVKSFF